MQDVSAESARASRDRKRGGPPRKLKPCGTYAAYRRHVRNGEEIDDACAQAWSEHQAEQYRKRQARKKGNP